MKIYFLHNGNEQEGPFDIEDLKAKKITKDTSVWHEGISDWTIAEKIEELKPLLANTPPPFNNVNIATPPIKKQEVNTEQTKPIKQSQSKSKLGIYVLIFVLLTTFIGGAFILANQFNLFGGSGSDSSSESYQEKVMTVEEIEKSQPTNFLSASGNYNKNFWGDKIKVHGEILNKATVATYKDAIVRITYYSKTNTELGSKEYTIYEVFPPNSVKNFELKIENYKDVYTIGWDVVSAVSN